MEHRYSQAKETLSVKATSRRQQAWNLFDNGMFTWNNHMLSFHSDFIDKSGRNNAPQNDLLESGVMSHNWKKKTLMAAFS